MPMKISIIIPVIRPENARKLICSIHLNSGLKYTEYMIHREVDHERVGAPKMVKELVERTWFDLVCFLGDDTEPQPDFLKIAKEKMTEFEGGWGLVGFNDLHHGPALATHWLAHKKLLDHLDGEFFYTGYRHQFCDAELHYRCNKIGRFKFAEDAVVKHNHPLLNGEKLTGDYERIYSKEFETHDKLLFLQRNGQGVQE